MKTALHIFLVGMLLATAVSYVAKPVTTSEKKPCGVNEVPTECKPCESFCNEEPTVCILSCTQGNYCQCKTNYLRISRNDRTCVPKEQCPSPTKPGCKKT